MSTYGQPSLFEEGPEPGSRPLPASIGRAAVRSLDTLHLLTPGRGRTADHDYTLNPYRGCSFGCSYCYAPFFEPDDDKRAAWGQWVEVKTRALEALEKVDLRGKRIYMSSVTDPYQPIEAKIGLTRSIVERLVSDQARLVVQTRSPIVERDIDLLQKFEAVRVNLSIPTDSDEVRKEFEPSCASIDRRLETVRRLKQAGIQVAVCISPMLPMSDPEGFGRRLSELGADMVTATWFHESTRPFAAGTREEGLELARQKGWTEKTFRDCKARLLDTCRKMAFGRMAFAPL